MHEFVAANLVVFVERTTRHIAFGHFEVTRPLELRRIHRAHLAAKPLAEVFQTSTHEQPAFRKRALRAAIHDLQKQFAHRRVNRVANEVCVERFQYRLADQNLRRHRRRMRHTRTTNRLDQRLFDDAIFHVERQFTGTLLRRTPTNTVRHARYVFDFFRLDPFALFRNGRRTVIWTFSNNTHFFDFVRVFHRLLLLKWFDQPQWLAQFASLPQIATKISIISTFSPLCLRHTPGASVALCRPDGLHTGSFLSFCASASSASPFMRWERT